MEKTKEVPGWYQRLLSLQTKPASESTFKQYCLENEPRLKVMYPFLPNEQIKGKLLATWKRKQPVKDKTSQKLKKLAKHPVVRCISNTVYCEKENLHQSTRTANPYTDTDWLCEHEVNSAEKESKREKTYRGRLFKPAEKVPEIISQTPKHEKSILKRGSSAKKNEGKRLQPFPRVSFISNDKRKISSFMNAPQSPPAVLSDSEEEHLQAIARLEILNFSTKSIDTTLSKQSSPSPNSGTKKKSRKKREMDDLSTEVSPREVQSEENVTDLIHPSKTRLSQNSISMKTKDAKKKRRGKSLKHATPQNFIEASPIPTFSQQLEPPTFGSPKSETPQKGKQKFCLFEDDWGSPDHLFKSPAKRKPCLKKSRKIKHSFSWSPAMTQSQRTPKLKKSNKSFLSQEKEETYYRYKQKRRVDETEAKKQPPETRHSRKTPKHKRSFFSQEKDKTCPRHKKKGHVFENKKSKQSTPLRCSKMEEKDKFHEKSRKDKAYGKQTQNLGFLAKEARYERHTRHSFEPDKTKERNDDENSNHSEVLFTEQSPLNYQSTLNEISEKENFYGRNALTEASLGALAKDHINSNQKHHNICKQREEGQNNILTYNKDVPLHSETTTESAAKFFPHEDEEQFQKQDDFEFDDYPDSFGREKSNEMRDDLEVDSPESNEQPHRRFQASQSPLLPSNKSLLSDIKHQGKSIRLSQMPEETSVLRQILFQLKNTASSSQNQCSVQSSPQSRITEISEMSEDGHLVDNTGLGGTSLVKNVFTQDAMASTPQSKSGNVLCDMFDSPDSAQAVKLKKHKRYLSACAEDDRISMLSSADTLFD